MCCSILHGFRFWHIKQKQQITQHAILYRPGGLASILPHCSFTTGCQWHSLNNVNGSNQKVIQFKTCFTLHAASHHPLPLSLSTTHVHKSNVNMQTACLHQPQGTGSGSSVCAASLLPPRNKWPVLSFPRPATTLSHLITCRRGNMTELCLKLWLLDDDTLRGRRGKLARQ